MFNWSRDTPRRKKVPPSHSPHCRGTHTRTSGHERTPAKKAQRPAAAERAPGQGHRNPIPNGPSGRNSTPTTYAAPPVVGTSSGNANRENLPPATGSARLQRTRTAWGSPHQRGEPRWLLTIPAEPFSMHPPRTRRGAMRALPHSHHRDSPAYGTAAAENARKYVTCPT